MISTTLPVAQLCKNQVIALGRQMEDNYRQIIFDVSDFDEPITSIMLVHQRKGDVAPYIVDTVSGTQFTWTITDTDTAYAGYGKGEIRINFDSGLAKSIVFTTMVVKSITGDTAIPSSLQSWYDAMIEYIDQHSTSPEQIEQAVADYLEEHPIEAPVQSVNGKTGTVVLTASDVGALPDSTIIPSRTSQLTNDSGFLSSVPAEYVTETELGTALAPKANTADLARVATSGEYADLTGKPTIPTVPTNVSAFNNDAGYLTSVPAEYVTETEMQTALAGKADTADIPTATSDLTNDSGYITSAGAPVQSVNGQTGAVTISVPTKTSDLTNDSGYITSAPVSSVNGRTGAVTGLAEQWTVQTMTASDTAVTLNPNVFYIFPEMASLAVTVTAVGMYAFRFTSGTTATTLTVTGATMPDSFSVESGKVYEVNVYQGYGVVSEWSA